MTVDRNGTELKTGDRVHVSMMSYGRDANQLIKRPVTIEQIFGKDGQFVQVEQLGQHHIPVHCARLCEKVET